MQAAGAASAKVAVQNAPATRSLELDVQDRFDLCLSGDIKLSSSVRSGTPLPSLSPLAMPAATAAEVL